MHLTPLVAENDVITGGDPERCGVVGVDHHSRPAFLRQRRRRLIEGRIEEAARRRRRKAERMLDIRCFDRRPVIRKPRHVGHRTALVWAAERNVGPIRFKPELPVRPRKAVEIMRFPERRLTVDPLVRFDLSQRATLRYPQHLIDELAWAHREAAMLRTEPMREIADHLVIAAALAGWLDQFGSENEILVPATAVDIVVLQKCCRRENDVGDLRGLRHELLMHADEKILARKPALHLRLIGTHRNRIGVLAYHRSDRRAAMKGLALPGEDCTETRLTEHPHRAIPYAKTLDQGPVEPKNVGADMEGTAALVLPGARNCRNTTRRVHVHGAIARARKAIAEAKKCALGFADQAREFLDRFHGSAGNRRGPLRIT